MLKKLFIILGFLIAILLLSSCSNSKLTQKDIDVNDAVVSVNGYYILKSDVLKVYDESKDSGVSYEKIVEDSILEILVVQQASKYDIKISEEEVDKILQDFKTEQNEYYSEAINIYGEENLKEKLRIRNLFSLTKDYVLKKEIIKNGISHDDIYRFEVKYNLVEQLQDYTDDEIINDLQRELEGFLFNEWMESLKSEAEIIYIQ